VSRELDPDDLLERSQWDFFWVPEDVRVVDRPELLYVSCPRDVQYLNYVTRTRAEAPRLPALVDEVVGAHANVRSRWLVRTMPGHRELERALAIGGYTPAVQAETRVVAVDDYRREAADELRVRAVSTRQELEDCIRVQEAAFGDTRAHTEAEIEAFLADCTRPGRRVVRYVAYDRETDRPVATGCMTAFADLRFGLLWGGGTVAEARGRGAYTTLVATRIAAARRLGLTHVGLYALVDTSAPIVAKQGFRCHGTMRYWDHAPD
jgi:hypothetical protein